MFEKWITAGWEEIPWILFSGIITYSAILIFIRIVGLRSLSKMTAADFLMTVAVGTLFASTISLSTPTLIVGLTAIATLYLGQCVIAWARRRFNWFSELIDNDPLLLMSGSQILDENLKKANVTRADLFGKLREANALNYDEVLAVVFEPTGDISVLHSQNADAVLEADFFQDVVGAKVLFTAENREKQT